MISESSATSTLNPPQTKASVLITVSTPGAETAICRISNSEEVVEGLSVRQLVQRVISPNSLLSIGVPMSQLEAESSAALAISELLSADCCEVTVSGKAGVPEVVSLDRPVREVAREQVGAQGNRFVSISLRVRSAADPAAPCGDDRRQIATPATVEVEETMPVAAGSSAEAESAPVVSLEYGWPTTPTRPSFDEPVASPPTSSDAADAVAPETPGSASAEAPGSAAAAPPSAPGASASSIFTIVAEQVKEEPKEQPRERKEYVRKSDWLRAQFLPEVEALDFSGLFVGNLGLGIREEKTRRNVVMADPARITEVLLRANGYRRAGDHAKALICYQELVDMDPANADFRFLLGKTLLALGQQEEAGESFLRAKELGHDGADKELAELRRAGHRPRAAFGFLRFWKQ